MELSCLSPFQSCPDDTALTGSTGQACPAIEMSGQGNGDYLIHTEISKTLSINARNLDIFGAGQFFCVISNSTTEFYHEEGVWNSGTGIVTCASSMVRRSDCDRVGYQSNLFVCSLLTCSLTTFIYLRTYLGLMLCLK